MGASFSIHRKWKEREEKDMNDYKEFYPTPEELVNKMLDGVNLMKIAKFNSTIHLYSGILFCTSGV